jgi:chromosome segregation ATPase
MQGEIAKQCQDVNTELLRTKSLLVAEEQRWHHEASKVDGINQQLRASHTEAANTQTKLERLQIEHRDVQHQLSECQTAKADLQAQMQVLGADIQRQKATISDYELLLAQQSQDIYESKDTLQQYRDQYQLVAEQLDASRRAEADLHKRNEQVRLQLDMQVEYVRDLEIRLEQALTRWKLEKDALREEKTKYARLSAQSANIVAVNKRQIQDIERYEARLKQYADLPLPVRAICFLYAFFFL